METAELTISLPREDVELAEQYVRAHHLTVNELIVCQLRRLRSDSDDKTHPEVKRISGLVPSDVNARAEYHERGARMRVSAAVEVEPDGRRSCHERSSS